MTGLAAPFQRGGDPNPRKPPAAQARLSNANRMIGLAPPFQRGGSNPAKAVCCAGPPFQRQPDDWIGCAFPEGGRSKPAKAACCAGPAFSFSGRAQTWGLACPENEKAGNFRCRLSQVCRDDWIRTSGLVVPNDARYRAALHPAHCPPKLYERRRALSAFKRLLLRPLFKKAPQS